MISPIIFFYPMVVRVSLGKNPVFQSIIMPNQVFSGAPLECTTYPYQDRCLCSSLPMRADVSEYRLAVEWMIEAIHQSVHPSSGFPETKSGGTTLSGAVLIPTKTSLLVQHFNIGDSKTVIVAADGEFVLRTKEHSPHLDALYFKTGLAYLSMERLTPGHFENYKIHIHEPYSVLHFRPGISYEDSLEIFGEIETDYAAAGVAVEWRLQTGLAMSRSIGDYVQLGVSCIPECEVVVLPWSRGPFHVLAATDGLWDVSGEKGLPEYFAAHEFNAEEVVTAACWAWSQDKQVCNSDDIALVYGRLTQENCLAPSLVLVADGHGADGDFYAELVQVVFQFVYPAFLAASCCKTEENIVQFTSKIWKIAASEAITPLLAHTPIMVWALKALVQNLIGKAREHFGSNPEAALLFCSSAVPDGAGPGCSVPAP